MLSTDDVFVIHKDTVFQGLFTSPVKNAPMSPSSIANIDLPTSPMSSSETYLALKDKYQMSLLRIKDKRKDGTKAKTLLRRQSSARISIMLDSVNTIAATPLKFLTESSDNVLLTVRKSTMKRQSLYTKKTSSPKITKHKYYNKKKIPDIFSAQFAENNLFKRGLTEPTPPSSLMKSTGVKLHPVADTELWLRLFPSSEDFTAVCEAVVSATEEFEILPSECNYNNDATEHLIEESPVVYTPIKASEPIETVAPEPTVNPIDQYAAMFPSDDVINARLTKDRRRASTMNYTGRTNNNKKEFDFENPMSASKATKPSGSLTPTKVVTDVIQFSARKMAALVKSMKKHDQSIRKSLVRSASAPVETSVLEEVEAPSEPETHTVAEPQAEWEPEMPTETSLFSDDYSCSTTTPRKSGGGGRKSRTSLGLVPLGELHNRQRGNTCTPVPVNSNAAAEVTEEKEEEQGPITVAPKLKRTPLASAVTGSARKTASLQEIKSPEYFFNMTSPMLSPLPASAATTTTAAPTPTRTPAVTATTPAAATRPQVVFRTPLDAVASSVYSTPLTGASTVPATPIGRLATPAPFQKGGVNKPTMCSLDSAMKFKIPDSICKSKVQKEEVQPEEEGDENMSEDQLNQSYFTDVPSPVPNTSTVTPLKTPRSGAVAAGPVTPLTVTPAKTPYSAFKNREGYVSTGKKRYDNKIRELFQSCDNVLSQISEFF